MKRSLLMYPAYARSERIADGAMHAAGVIGAVGGAVVLVAATLGEVSGGMMAALIVYVVALLATFLASAFYHMTPWEGLRPTLRRIDHAAIYLKIAGTYTPLVAMIGSGFGYVILALVWLMALGGMINKLFFWRSPGKLGPLLYLAMGWMSLLLIWSLAPVLPTTAMWLVALGGLTYSTGVVFFNWDQLKFSLAIWHGFVLAGSSCFYAAIALGSTSLI